VEKKPLLEGGLKVEKKYLPSSVKKMIKIENLRQNTDFQKILKQKKINNNYFTIFFGNNVENLKKNKRLHISFVMKKKIGTAVKRNKIKRKLKSAVQNIVRKSKSINLNYNYIIFGKADVYREKFSIVSDEQNNVFKKIKTLGH
jgi:ribonuclease P protein component